MKSSYSRSCDNASTGLFVMSNAYCAVAAVVVMEFSKVILVVTMV